MNEHSAIADSPAPDFSIAQFRAELGLTLAEMGERVGLSKSQMHDVEKSGRASLTVALEIERLSGGRIDASDLNDGVRASRHGLEVRTPEACRSTGNTEADSRAAADNGAGTEAGEAAGYHLRLPGGGSVKSAHADPSATAEQRDHG